MFQFQWNFKARIAVMQNARKLVNWLMATYADLADEGDFFRPMTHFLWIGGIYLPSRNVFLRYLFYCYRALVVTQVFVWLNRLYAAIFVWNSPEDLIGVACFFVGLTAIFSRVGSIRLYLREVLAVRQYLGCQLNGQRSEKRDQAFRLIRRIALVLEGTFFVDQIMFHVFGVSQYRQFSLPDHFSRLDWRVKLFFEAAIASNHFVLSSIYVTALTVMSSLLMALDAEMQEIVVQFQTIFERTDSQQVQIMSRLKIQSGLRGRVKEILFLKIVKKELNFAISRHCGLLHQFETLSNYFKLTFLSMFYMDIVILSCAAFYIRLIGLNINTLVTASYAAAHLLESFWFCHLSEKLNNANQQIGFTLYDLDWHQRLQMIPELVVEYREIRTAIQVVMVKSRECLGLSCGGMFEMSHAAFYELVKMIYSLLTFLVNTTAAGE